MYKYLPVPPTQPPRPPRPILPQEEAACRMHAVVATYIYSIYDFYMWICPTNWILAVNRQSFLVRKYTDPRLNLFIKWTGIINQVTILQLKSNARQMDDNWIKQDIQTERKK